MDGRRITINDINDMLRDVWAEHAGPPTTIIVSVETIETFDCMLRWLKLERKRFGKRRHSKAHTRYMLRRCPAPRPKHQVGHHLRAMMEWMTIR